MSFLYGNVNNVVPIPSVAYNSIFVANVRGPWQVWKYKGQKALRVVSKI